MKVDLSNKLQETIKLKALFKMPLKIEAQINFQQHSIIYHQKQGSFLLCGSNKKTKIQGVKQNYVQAFNHLDLNSKILTFAQNVQIFKYVQDKKSLPQIAKIKEHIVYIKSGLLTSWNQVFMYIDPIAKLLKITKQGESQIYQLSSALLRKSKNKQKFAFVIGFWQLKKQLRLGYDIQQKYIQVFENIRQIIAKCKFIDFKNQLSLINSRRSTISYHQTLKKEKSLLQTIIWEQVSLKKIKQSKKVDLKNKTNLAFTMHPYINLNNFKQTIGFQVIQSNQQYILYRHRMRRQRVRIEFKLNNKSDKLALIASPEVFKLNRMIKQFFVKKIFLQQNLVLYYYSYNINQGTFRQRDAVLIRHVCTLNQTLFILDKSIQNQLYPPFATIIRSNFNHIVTAISLQDCQPKIIIDIQAFHQGYLSSEINLKLSIDFLLQFLIFKKVSGKKPQIQFSLDWDPPITSQLIQLNSASIKQYQSNYMDVLQEKRSNFQEDNYSLVDQFVSVVSQPQQFQAQLKFERLTTKLNIIPQQIYIPQLNQIGLSVISYDFLNTKHPLKPFKDPLIRLIFKHPKHFIWKGQWQRNQQGGLVYVDQQRMAQQRKVIKFVLSKIGHNLLQGKSITQISLPVDIFCPFSNLQKFARSLGLAPHFLQQAGLLSDPVEQLQKVMCFFFSYQIFYIQMEKPFNPILGQTFQCWIKGCPVYVQQISHHPPIHSLQMIGLNFQLSCTLQAAISLKLNSGAGSFIGNYKILLKNNDNQIIIRGNQGELSGLTLGERKFNFVGQTRIFCPRHQLVLFIKHNPDQKGFFSFSKQATPNDYLKGQILKVRSQYFNDLNNNYKKSQPSKQLIQQKLNQITGLWPLYIKVDGKTIYDIQNTVPYAMDYQKYPLPSDSVYRQDIIYRRLGNTIRAQAQKERLEVIQRNDRKLREKLTGKKH